MDTEKMAKKRPVDILTRENWREWFKLLELHFIGEGLDFVLHNTEEEYCAYLTVRSGLSTGANTPVTDGKEPERPGEPEKLASRKGMNIEKQQKFRKAAAKVLYTMSIYLDSIDNDLIDEFSQINKKWHRL